MSHLKFLDFFDSNNSYNTIFYQPSLIWIVFADVHTIHSTHCTHPQLSPFHLLCVTVFCNPKPHDSHPSPLLEDHSRFGQTWAWNDEMDSWMHIYSNEKNHEWSFCNPRNHPPPHAPVSANDYGYDYDYCNDTDTYKDMDMDMDMNMGRGTDSYFC